MSGVTTRGFPLLKRDLSGLREQAIPTALHQVNHICPFCQAFECAARTGQAGHPSRKEIKGRPLETRGERTACQDMSQPAENGKGLRCGPGVGDGQAFHADAVNAFLLGQQRPLAICPAPQHVGKVRPGCQHRRPVSSRSQPPGHGCHERGRAADVGLVQRGDEEHAHSNYLLSEPAVRGDSEPTEPKGSRLLASTRVESVIQ